MAPTDEDLFAARVRRAVHGLRDAPAAWRIAAGGLLPGVARVAVAALRQRVRALLAFDSWLQPATAMRGTPCGARQLMFSADGRDVDLRIAPRGAAFTLAGQLLGSDEPGAVELTCEDAGFRYAHVAPMDALGAFRIGGVAAGTYVLTLHLAGDDIVLPALRLGPWRD